MTLLITILPSVLILLYFILSDKFREPRRTMVEVFGLGVAATFPAGYLNNTIEKTFQNGDIINDALLTGFFAGGLVEEALKFMILYYFVLKKKEFNEPMDGIVYGVLASLGFATFENLEYVYLQADTLKMTSYDLAKARFWTAVPMHGLNGCVMGFYFGLYAFTGIKKYMGYSFVLPLIFHGTYNFLVGIGSFAYILILIILLVLSLKLHKQLKLLQTNKDKEAELKIV